MIRKSLLFFIISIISMNPIFGESLKQTAVWLKTLDIYYNTGDLETLKWLDLSGKEFDNRDLIFLDSLPELLKLDLSGSSLNDEGMSYLKNLDHLEILIITDTQISDRGAESIFDMEGLKEVTLPSQISERMQDNIKSGKPGINIIKSESLTDEEFIAYGLLIFIAILSFAIPYKFATYLKRGNRVLFSVSILFFLAGMIMLVDSISFYMRAERTQGRVVELVLKFHSSGDSGDSAVYHPRVQFSTPGGEQIEFLSDMGSNPPAYEVDEPVAVIFDPYIPSRAEISNPFGIFTVFSYSLTFFIFAGIMGFSSGGLKPVQHKVYSLIHPDPYERIRRKLKKRGLKHTLDEIKNLDRLWLSGDKIINSDLADISHMKKLKGLDLSDSFISDKGISSLASLASLQELDLSRTQISDKALRYISQMRSIKELDLSSTGITDEGMELLMDMDNLETLTIYDTKVTREGVDKLKSYLNKDCDIEY